MKTIQLVFTKSRLFLPLGSWAIRLWTWKSYSHVAKHTIIDSEHMFYQSNDGKVNYEHKDVFLKKHKIVKVYRIKVPCSMCTNIHRECLKNAGKPYAFLQNLGIVIVDIFKNIGIKIRNPWKKGKNCSELVYSLILKKLYPELKYDPDTIKPHHIEKILIQKNYKCLELHNV